MTIAEQFVDDVTKDMPFSNAIGLALSRVEARLKDLETSAMWKAPEQPKGAEWIDVRNGEPIFWVYWDDGDIQKGRLNAFRNYTHIRPYIPGEDKPEAPEVAK